MLCGAKSFSVRLGVGGAFFELVMLAAIGAIDKALRVDRQKYPGMRGSLVAVTSDGGG